MINKVNWMGEYGKKNLVEKVISYIILKIYIIYLSTIPYLIFIY